jgi:hypothetical protein
MISFITGFHQHNYIKITTIIGVHHQDLILVDVLIDYKLNLSHHQAYISNIISGSTTLLYNNMETNPQS